MADDDDPTIEELLDENAEQGREIDRLTLELARAREDSESGKQAENRNDELRRELDGRTEEIQALKEELTTVKADVKKFKASDTRCWFGTPAQRPARVVWRGGRLHPARVRRDMR